MMPDIRDIPLYYDVDGKPYPGSLNEQLFAWADDFEKRKDGFGIIGQETLWTGIFVSTLWLGLDHNYFDDGPPLIYESMAFTGDKEELDQERYSTSLQAKIGHARLVKKYSQWKWIYIIFWRSIKRRIMEVIK